VRLNAPRPVVAPILKASIRADGTCLNLKTAALLLNLAFIWLSSLNL
jgi:hypothetical protein